MIVGTEQPTCTFNEGEGRAPLGCWGRGMQTWLLGEGCIPFGCWMRGRGVHHLDGGEGHAPLGMWGRGMHHLAVGLFQFTRHLIVLAVVGAQSLH